ncbi:hypothetical protein C6497_06825 [Candidatus Poribacteria bacterium]|nr:MAG: hypothetical protein C6497_06825 [Candidatus Poribacteria bacterium]
MKFSRILIILGIICVASLLLFFGVKLQAQNKDGNITTKLDEKNINIENINANLENRRQRSNRGSENRQQGSRWSGQARSRNSDSGENSSFYQVIIDNSLFRPLGWKPPNKEPEYAFVGTTIYIDDTKKSEANVLERRSNRFYTVNVGDEVGDAIVKEIKEKEIILDKDGETITLKGGNLQFLSKGNSNRGNSRGNSEESAENNNEANEERNNRNREASAREGNRRETSGASEMRRRFQSASSEERMRMIQQFRERGRGRRGGR